MSSQSTVAPRKLPFWQTVGGCYMTVIRNFGQLPRISWLWLLIMLPLYAIMHWLTWSPATVPPVPEEGILALFTSFLPGVVELPALASIAVAWHRLVLREESVGRAFYLRLDQVVWRYALVMLVFYILVAAPFVFGYSRIFPVWLDPKAPSSAAALSALATLTIGVAVTLAIAGFLLPRLSLMLPAIALGEPLSAAAAWRVSRGNTWRLLWASVLCSLPLYLLLFAPLDFYFRDETQASSALVGAIGSLISVLIVTVGVTLLSLSYRYFVRPQDVGGLAPQPNARGPAAA